MIFVATDPAVVVQHHAGFGHWALGLTLLLGGTWTLATLLGWKLTNLPLRFLAGAALVVASSMYLGLHAEWEVNGGVLASTAFEGIAQNHSVAPWMRQVIGASLLLISVLSLMIATDWLPVRFIAPKLAGAGGSFWERSPWAGRRDRSRRPARRSTRLKQVAAPAPEKTRPVPSASAKGVPAVPAEGASSTASSTRTAPWPSSAVPAVELPTPSESVSEAVDASDDPTFAEAPTETEQSPELSHVGTPPSESTDAEVEAEHEHAAFDFDDEDVRADDAVQADDAWDTEQVATEDDVEEEAALDVPPTDWARFRARPEPDPAYRLDTAEQTTPREDLAAAVEEEDEELGWDDSSTPIEAATATEEEDDDEEWEALDFDDPEPEPEPQSDTDWTTGVVSETVAAETTDEVLATESEEADADTPTVADEGESQWTAVAPPEESTAAIEDDDFDFEPTAPEAAAPTDVAEAVAPASDPVETEPSETDSEAAYEGEDDEWESDDDDADSDSDDDSDSSEEWSGGGGWEDDSDEADDDAEDDEEEDDEEDEDWEEDDWDDEEEEEEEEDDDDDDSYWTGEDEDLSHESAPSTDPDPSEPVQADAEEPQPMPLEPAEPEPVQLEPDPVEPLLEESPLLTPAASADGPEFVADHESSVDLEGLRSIVDGVPENERESFVRTVRVLVGTDRISLSRLQRELGVTYFVAARLFEHLEVAAMISKYDGSLSRDVTLDRAAWEEYLQLET